MENKKNKMEKYIEKKDMKNEMEKDTAKQMVLQLKGGGFKKKNVINNVGSAKKNTLYHNVISGTMNQSDTNFSDISRNRQCTAIAVFSIVFSTIHPPETWSWDSVNSILFSGDQLYIESIFKQGPDFKEIYLTCDEVYNEISIDLANFVVEYSPRTRWGIFKNDFEYQLKSFFNEFTNGVFTCLWKSMCLMHVDNIYYWFDSHSNSASDSATLYSFISIEDIIKFVRETFSNNSSQFTITPVIVTRLANTVLVDSPVINPSDDLQIPQKHSVGSVNKNILYRNVISGSINQNDDEFSDISRNRQCTAIAVFSVVCSTIHPPEIWTWDLVNSIVISGDELYKKSVVKLGPDFNEIYLACDEVYKKIEIGIAKFTVEYLTNEQRQGYNFKNDIENQLKSFFNEFTYGVFTCSLKSMSLIHVDNIYYWFDSHSNSVRENAALFSFISVEDIINFIRETFLNTNAMFSIMPLIVTRLADAVDLVDLVYVPDINAIDDLQIPLKRSAILMNNSNEFENENTKRRCESPNLCINASQDVLQISDYSPLVRDSVFDLSQSFSDLSAKSVSPKISPRVTRSKKILNLTNTSKSKKPIQKTQKKTVPKNETSQEKSDRLKKEAERKQFIADRAKMLAFNSYENIVEDDVIQHNLGSFKNICRFCGAFHFKSEMPKDNEMNLCCNKGAITLDYRRSYPKLLSDLYKRKHVKSEHYMKYIRVYNNVLSFGSFEATCDKTLPKGVPIVKVNGMIYHKMTYNDENIHHGQTYIFETDEATDHRVNSEIGSNLDKNLLKELDSMLRPINKYTQMYKMLSDIEKENELLVQNGGERIDIRLAIVHDRSAPKPQDMAGAYDKPTINEVCMIYDKQTSDRDIMIFPKNSEKVIIKYLNPNRDSLVYPLLFPYADQTYHIDIKKNISRRHVESSVKHRVNVSLRQYYCYRFMARSYFDPIFHAEKLTQQYIIDMFAKLEDQRLSYLKLDKNQKKLRKDSYNGLHDFVRNAATDANLRPGRVIILPSSYYGSERNNKKNYLNAMAVVQKFGKPSFFITFTCNKNWPEIQDNLNGATVEGRPDLVARVFKAKLAALVDDLKVKQIFGKFKALIYTIEFQKRGLPHAHMLLFVDNDVDNATDLDDVICAEIPDKNTHPRLYEIVSKFMIHGPCGAFNEGCVCMEKKNGLNVCSKKYPRDFRDESDCNLSGYPLYRRRNNGKTVDKKVIIDHRRHTIQLSNQWVIPYNPYLLLKYNAHINVELCSSLKSIKYLFKYCFKGTDRAKVLKTNIVLGVVHYDEIGGYIDARCVTAPESIWRLFEFILQFNSHTTFILPIHLPGEQEVIFDESDLSDIESICKNTMLTAYFKLNEENKNFVKADYLSTPLHYTYCSKKREWTLRKYRTSNVIVRIVFVSPRDHQRYALKQLLQHIVCPKSFEDCRTVNGVLYPTFVSAANALGLLSDDTLYMNTMLEACSVNMPYELRRLFAHILLFCSISDPITLFNRFENDLCEDYVRKYDVLIAKQILLNDINCILVTFGKCNADFGLPMVDSQYVNLPQMEQYSEIFDQTEEENHFLEYLPKLNVDQKNAFDKIKTVIEDKTIKERYFILDGPGGSGKTFLYDVILSYCRINNISVIPVAWTGIAAALMKGGRTVHSRFRLPLDITDTTTCNIKSYTQQGRELIAADIIIWDEVTMSNGRALDAIDILLRDLMNLKHVPFGGKVILLGGDFRQCLPVVPMGIKSDILRQTIKVSKIWPIFEKISLRVNMRLNVNEIEFSNWLLNVGNGTQVDCPRTRYFDMYVKIPNECIVKDIRTAIYGDKVQSNELPLLYQSTILTPLNADVDQLNEAVYSSIAEDKSSEKIYYSIDKALNDDESENFPVSYLNTLTPTGFPSHVLKLKVGVPVILLRNFDTKRGLCNGTRLIVKQLLTHSIIVEIIGGSHKGVQAIIPKVTIESQQSLPCTLSRVQIPVKLCFAMTIHKAQGQTFDKVGLYLTKPCFAHGQLYVALSRVKSKQNLKINVVNSLQQGQISETSNEYFVPNIVYKEIFN